jgi:pimeloyl-ACP methyl ester carboxylesterase
MRRSGLFTAVFALAIGMAVAFGASAAKPQPRAHVYLLRGLLNVFSLGMDSLAEELKGRDVYATVHSYSDWQTLADQAAADYKAGKEAPIILIGHSLGADAVMEMAAYLGGKGVPVALVVPFDCTKSFVASDNVARVLNLTHGGTPTYMRGGPGFRGTLANVDVSSDASIDHINIDKSPQLHARVVTEVLAVIGNRRAAPAKKGMAPMDLRRPGQPGGSQPSGSQNTGHK